MAYTYFPARQTNFFPPQVPYFAGLGDYASDLAAYKTAMRAWEPDNKRWAKEKIAYDAAMAAYNTALAQAKATYATRIAAYKNAYSQYEKNYATWQAAAAAWDAQMAAIKRDNIAAAQKIATGWGLSLPQSFLDSGACITQAQRDAYVRNCSTVSGLGQMRGLGSGDPDCGWKLMPVCKAMSARPFPPTRPTPPSEPIAPRPPAPLRPPPVMPIAPPAPPPATIIPSGSGSGSGGGGAPLVTPEPVTPVTTLPADDTKKAGMISNGLILLAVGVGGYLVYRTFKKPKAAA